MLSIKQLLTRGLGEPCIARFFGATRLNFPSLRLTTLKNSERILTKQKSCNFASSGGTQSKSWNMNTNVANNVLLYKYDRPKLFLFLNVFAPFQCVFWMCTAYFHYKYLPKYDSTKESMYDYVLTNFIALLISSAAAFTGISLTFLIYTYTTRSIKCIVLRKGGEAVTFLTYRPIKTQTGLTVPVQNVTCRTPRREMINYLPVRIKDRRFFYILDAGGEFINPRLFDCTVGYYRPTR